MYLQFSKIKICCAIWLRPITPGAGHLDDGTVPSHWKYRSGLSGDPTLGGSRFVETALSQDGDRRAVLPINIASIRDIGPPVIEGDFYLLKRPPVL